MRAIWHPSPNFGPRRDGLTPTMIVVHFTEMRSAQAALDRLCDPAAEVSAHYLIGRCGTLWQMVREQGRAWHAGAGCWRGLDDVNSRSIGIEIDNDGYSPFAARAMATLETLLGDLRTRWSIAARDVIAHSDMAPGRKVDPGPRFDWRRLALLGHALHVDGSPSAALLPDLWAGQSLHDLLDRIGYPPAPAATRLAAFRLRFNPTGTGPETVRDRDIAAVIAEMSDQT